MVSFDFYSESESFNWIAAVVGLPERTILKLKQTLLLLDKPTRLRDGNVTAIQ